MGQGEHMKVNGFEVSWESYHHCEQWREVLLVLLAFKGLLTVSLDAW